MKSLQLVFLSFLLFTMLSCDRGEIVLEGPGQNEVSTRSSVFDPPLSPTTEVCDFREIQKPSGCDITFDFTCEILHCASDYMDGQLDVALSNITWQPYNAANSTFEIWNCDETRRIIVGTYGGQAQLQFDQFMAGYISECVKIVIPNESCWWNYEALAVINPPITCEDQNQECPGGPVSISGAKYIADITIDKTNLACPWDPNKSTIYMQMDDNGSTVCFKQFDFDFGELSISETVELPADKDFWFVSSTCPHQNHVCPDVHDQFNILIDNLNFPEISGPGDPPGPPVPYCTDIFISKNGVQQSVIPPSASTLTSVQFTEYIHSGCIHPDISVGQGNPVIFFPAPKDRFKVWCAYVSND